MQAYTRKHEDPQPISTRHRVNMLHCLISDAPNDTGVPMFVDLHECLHPTMYCSPGEMQKRLKEELDASYNAGLKKF